MAKPQSYLYHHWAVGWPVRSLQAWSWWHPGTYRIIGAISLSPAHLHYLAARPIWPGFAVNTVFYAAVLWLLIPGPFVLLRTIRLRRGLCPKCTYPMGESPICTECGKALPGRTETMT